MWTRTNNKTNGTFSFQVRDWNGEIYAEQHGFVDYKECENKAIELEREMTRKMMVVSMPEIDETVANMTDDELLAELGI